MTEVALIFPGQGAQHVGMGKEFYDSSAKAKAIFDSAETIVSGLTDVIFNGPEDVLTSTKFCQPAIFTFSVAALEALKEHSNFSCFQPRFACGLSLGEYSALVASGALSFIEALKLVERRSFFMEEATQIEKGAMAAVIGFDKNLLIKICGECGAEVANFNAPDQIVITGTEAAVLKASEQIKEQGAKRVIPLVVSGAFHSSLMAPAVPNFKTELTQAAVNPASFSVLSNVDANPTTDPELIRENLALQITSSVEWVRSIEAIAATGVSTFFEIGPGTVLKGLLRKINRDLKVHNIRTPEDISKLSD